ncbi:MAG: (d)CMP kinase [Candidatus Neomarinimicrobiota bacterium]|jgi:cytidylate kinase|nr:MAG: (d)CMP kinase [Candidatus Neomarinimicrobiota bacterium]
MIVAIDGPAASGKSTTAKMVAKKLQMTYLDTGAMYRAVTLALLRSNTDLDDYDSVCQVVDELELDIYDQEGKTVVILDGEDVSQAIRSVPVTKNVSAVSAMKYVREAMVEIQRNIGKKTNCVVEGRDIGTVVFPDAEFKIFMVADVKMRAERRLKELQEMGDDRSLQEVMADLKRRDKKDSTRAHSPLQKAGDAIEIDTSMLSINQQVEKVEKIINLVREKNN